MERALSSMCRPAPCWSAAGDEGNDDVRGVAVEVLTSAVVHGCGAGGGELDIAERYAGVECGHDEGGAQHVWVDDAENCSFAD